MVEIVTNYKNEQQKPKSAPKHELNDKQAKYLKELEERNKREISTYRGGYNVGD
jgi:hypothetical protein